MRQLLSVGTAADPDSRVQIRILPGEAGPPGREHLKAFNADPASTLAVHLLVSESWVFDGSYASVTAASEHWREHFDVEDEELAEDRHMGWEPD